MKSDAVGAGSADFRLALEAAARAAGAQDYPAGALYVVATPIGNLADISLRALHVLELADAIACEDTRHTGQLLRAYGLPAKPLLSVHEHNEQVGAQGVLVRLQAGERVAYASDAGTPAVSDPGARLVAACAAAGLRVVPLPGASSPVTALCTAGLSGDGTFLFRGFLPPKAGERQQALAALTRETRAVVLLEAPHRIRALADELAALGDRRITVARELTKQFEHITTLSCSALPAWFDADPARQRGEFALVLHPGAVAEGGGDPERILRLLLAQLPLKSAVKLAAEITAAPRNALYERALTLRHAPE